MKRLSRSAAKFSRFQVEALEDRVTPAIFAVGANPLTPPTVSLYDSTTGALVDQFLAYDAGFLGGVKVAQGSFSTGANPDVVTGSGRGTSHVKVFDGDTKAELFSFLAFDPGFAGGVDVTTGDINGDGTDDIIVVANGGGTNGHVKVFDGTNGAEIQSFFALAGVTGDVNLASGDVDGDGKDDVVVSGLVNGSALVRAVSGADGSELLSFTPFPGFGGPVSVASGDVDGDGKADVVVGVAATGAADVGAPSHVKVFSGATGAEIESFYAFDPAFRGGVVVGVTGDVDGDGAAEILVSSGAGAPSDVRVLDGDNQTVLQTFAGFGNGYIGGGISPGPVNRAPTAADNVVATGENTPLTVAAAAGVLTNDTDPDSDTLTVTQVNGVAGNVGTPVTLASGAVVTLNADGSFTYDPNGKFESLAAGSTTTDTFSYTVGDGNGGTDTATVTVVITGVNDNPVATNDPFSTNEDTPLSAGVPGVLANDTDPDVGPSLTVNAVNGSAANVGTQITLASGALLTLNADGSFAYDPNGKFEPLAVGESGTDSFTYTVSDGTGASNAATVTLTITGVNDAPNAVNDTQSTVEDGTVNFDARANDTDPDTSDALAVTQVNGAAVTVGVPVALTSGATVTLNANGTLTYDPNGAFNALAAGESDTDSFTYTVSDGNGGTDTATVNLTITGANDGLTAVDDSQSTDEDTASNFDARANDTDPDTSDALTVTQINGAAVAVGVPVALPSGATVTLNANGTLTYDPTTSATLNALAAGESTSDSFTYTVSDGNGGTDTATVSFTVNGANDAPTATDDSRSTNEDTPLVVAAPGVLANDTDSDTSDSLTVSAVNGLAINVGAQITLASGALLTLNADGSFSYDPNGIFDYLAVGESTTDSFTYSVSDGNGGTDTATVTITINGVNDAPTATDDSQSTSEDSTSNFDARANDTDPDTSDALTVTQINGAAVAVGVPVTLPSGATVTLFANGTLTYDPNGQFEYLAAGESTSDSFTYTVSDGNGGTDTATVTFTVNGANDAPTATDDPRSTDEDTPLVVAAPGVLTNDTDPDTSDSLTVSAVNGLAINVGAQITLASGALLTLNADGSFSYDPNGQFESLGAGESDTDSFTYTVSDGNGGTDSATVTITINGVNDAPNAVDDSGSTLGPTSSTNISVLVNDTDVDVNDTVTVTLINGVTATVGNPVTLGSGATATLLGDGSITYDPTGAGFMGGETDTFTYTISDGNGGTDTATVSVMIGGV